MTLPPGQWAIDGFPRFGANLGGRPPAVPAEPSIEVTGAVIEPIRVALVDLDALPRREMTADFHCVGGWSATGVRWAGVAFDDFYRRVIEPSLVPGTTVSHLVFAGADGYRSFVELRDVITGTALLADRLDGRPLDGDHGAPVRLVSPDQYGYVSTKHLCGIEVHTREPVGTYHSSRLVHLGLQLLKPHRRARVWREERHRYVPARLVRPIYRRLVPVFMAIGTRGRGEIRRDVCDRRQSGCRGAAR